MIAQVFSLDIIHLIGNYDHPDDNTIDNTKLKYYQSFSKTIRMPGKA
jgi:hypothetical protein